VGQLEAPTFNLDILDARLRRPDYARVLASLEDMGAGSITDFLSTYSGNSAELQPWLKDAAINHDADLRLQYLAGLALNHSEENAIHTAIMKYWTPPIGLFTGSPERLDALFSAMTEDSKGAQSGPIGRRAD